jgi:hypothetical protein
MPHLCRVCNRLSPDAARYCHYDGAAFISAEQGPIAVGARLFPTPFVFPSGKSCRTFDELVLGCDTDWEMARDLLAQGTLEKFLGGIGRGDLAVAAQVAAREADRDRGLDQLLAQLPGDRTRPILVVEPREVNLGRLSRGEGRTFTLYLSNGGMGLLSGAVQSQAPWLTLYESAGSSSKVFQCRHEYPLTVHVHGKALRAHPQPQEGRLVIDSVGGGFTVLVRVEAPPLPYPDGVLAGAITPRQIAEKAKRHPHEAARCFESGAVARWYESNGWTYPVQGPSASGMAAVQQFFEALGLTKPPRLILNQNVVKLTGAPAGNVESFLFLESPESRPVYAHAKSETPWLQIGKLRHQGNTVRIHLRVPSVPPLPGQTLQGRAVITANGNQRFPVQVTLAIDNVPVRAISPTREQPAIVQVDAVEPSDNVPIREVDAVPGLKARVLHLEPPPRTIEPPPEPASEPPPEPLPSPAPLEDWPHEQRKTNLGHLLPLALLLALLFGAVVHDLLLPNVGDDDEAEPVLIDPRPLLALRFHEGENPDDFKIAPGTMSFGLRVIDPGHPEGGKRLMFDPLGRTNNVCVRIDGIDYLFGQNEVGFPTPGAPAEKVPPVAHWIEMSADLGKDKTGRVRDGARSIWQVDGLAGRRCAIQITQTVEIVVGQQSGRLDTCLIRYAIRNADSSPHEVGLRFLLDTWIGENDGVPFTIPNKPGLCSTKQSFDRPEDVPDYIQALENESLLAPGTVAHLQFKTTRQLEPPSRVLLGGYPDGPLKELGYAQANGWYTPWEVPLVAIRELVDRRNELLNPPRSPAPDSAVTLYWGVKKLAPKESREVGFTYGLGSVASGEGEGKLLLTLGGRTVRDGEFTLTALRASPTPGEKLILLLPGGDRFALLSPAEQPVPPVAADSSRPISTVTWRLKARRTGRSTLTVRSSAGVTQNQSVRISRPAQGVLD